MSDNGTLSLWEKLKSLVAAEISKQTRSCCRMKSMVVVSPYDATTKTVGVKEAFGQTVNLPVVGTLDTSKLLIGTSVWVMMPHSSMSNAIVVMLGDGSGASVSGVPLATTTTAGIVQIGNGLNVDNGVVSVNPSWSQIANYLYPVGCIVELTVSTNPASLWGIGTWESYMPGRVLVGTGTAESGTVYEAGATGGEETHALTTNEMPSHRHEPILRNSTRVSLGNGDADSSKNYYKIEYTNTSGYVGTPMRTDLTGGGAAHNNMQPYGVVYRWVRIA